MTVLWFGGNCEKRIVNMSTGVAFPVSSDPVKAMRFPATAARRPVDISLGDAALVAAGFALLIGVVAPKASTVVQMVLAAVFIFIADVRFLPALIVLQFTVTDFKGGVAASMETQYERFEGIVIFVAGFPFTTNYVLLLALLLRVLYDVLTRPRILRGTQGVVGVVAWLCSLGVAVNNSFLGRAMANPSWSAPTRIALSYGAVWLGAVMNVDRGLLLEVLRRRIAPLVIVVLGLAFCEAVVNRLTWLMIALGITLSVDAWFGDANGRRRPVRAALLLLLALAIGFGLRATPAMMELARQRGGSFTATLTTMLVPLITGGIILIGRPSRGHPFGRSRPRAPVVAAAAAGYVAFCVFPFIVSALTAGVDVEARGRGENMTIRERVAYKLFLERAAIWRGAIDQMSEPPYVFVPAGREGYLITNAGRSGRFKQGAHNMVLEALRSEGFVVGIVTLYFFGVVVVAGLTACLVRPDAVGRILGPAVVAAVIGTGVSGASVLDPTLGFFTLLFGGICLAGNHASRGLPARVSAPQASDGVGWAG